jgi:hypothetical protein
MAQGTFTFPGVPGVITASVSFGLGITPSSTSLTIPPSPGLSRLGTAVWSYGGTVRSLPGSVVSRIQVGRAGGLTVWNVAILDRRWRWAFGQISGEYNIQGEDGVVTEGQKSPRKLATLCLEAMGETGYDVSALPENDTPYVQWDAEVPAKALADICDLYSCAVTLLLNDTVGVVQLGNGQPLPPGWITKDDTIELTNVPTTLAVLSAKARWQVDLPTEAVGLDTDGTVKPIGELSYAPPAGWATVGFNDYGFITDPTERGLAVDTVYKWYRVKLPDTAHPNGTLPDLEDQPTDVKQMLPLIDRLVTRTKANDDEDFDEAIVWGRFADWQGVGSNNFNNAADPLNASKFSKDYVNPISYNVDTELGILKFSEPQVIFEPDPNDRLGALPAQLFYRCSITVKTAETREFYRRKNEVSVDPTSPAGTKYLIREDVLPTYRFDVASWVNNTTEIDEQAEFYLDQEVAKYIAYPGADAEYDGFVPASVDGAIRQVSYSIDASGLASSKLAYNIERLDSGVTFEQARRSQLLSEMIEKRRRDMRRRKRGANK